MANVTINPRSRLSRIPSGRTYSDVAAKYAASFAAAIDKQEQNEIQSNFDAFKLGTLTYDAFKKYLTDKIATAPIGTTNNANWNNILVQAETFNTTNINNMASQKADSLRTQYLQQIKGPVTTKNQLEIVQNIIKQIPKESKVYNDLVQEEMSLKNKVQAESVVKGKGDVSNRLDQFFSLAIAENNKIRADYAAGRITGVDADRQLYQNGVELNTAVKQAQNAGVNIPAAVQTELADGIVNLNDRLAKREVGQVFDVYNQKTGELEPVTHQDVLTDKANGEGKYTVSKYSVVYDDATKRFSVIETATGTPMGNTYKAETQATNAIKALDVKTGGEFSVSVPKVATDPNTGVTQIARTDYTFKPDPNDPTTGTFVSPQEPNKQVFTPNPNVGERFLTQAGAKLQDFIAYGANKLQKFLSPNEYGGTSVDLKKLETDYVMPTGMAGPVLNPPVLPTPGPEKLAPSPAIGKPTVDITKDVFGKARPVVKPEAYPGANFAKQFGVGTTGPQLTPTTSPITPSFTPTTFNPLQPFAGTGPERLRSNFVGPNLSPTTAGGTNQTPTTTQQPSLFEKIKQFGSSALGAVRKTFGF